jgi:predicted metal-binding membrane protein
LPALGSVERLLSRNSIIAAAALALAAALAWAWLLSQPAGGGVQMAGMGMQPRPLSAGYLLPAFAMWSLMMVAMMLPSAAPMILLHARINRSPSARERLFHTLLFGLGYLLVWEGFSALAVGAQALLVAAGVVSGVALSVGPRALAAGLLITAALYELTAAKRLCLDTCQSPLVFVFRHWRPGAGGAVRFGIIHGLYCVGCCWALMLLLFVGGVMNLAWVALLAILILAEKLAPSKWHAERYFAAALGAGAIAALIG